MSTIVAGRKGLVAVIAVLSLLPVPHPGAVLSGASQGGGCGPSLEGVNRLNADLGLDNSLANRANSLASSALKNGQAPSPDQTQALAEDSLDGLSDAADQLDQATDEISKQLEELKLPRQQRMWNQSVSDMKTARGILRSALRQDPVARGQRISSLSATGVGPKTVYEAATNYQSSVENLGGSPISFDQAGQTSSLIRGDQNGWMDTAKGQGQVLQGAQDARTPANPGPDPWQEWLNRLRAQQARIHNSVNGLNAAQSLRAGDFQQAQKNVAEMQKAMQSAQNFANQLSQLAALCNQLANQRPQQNNPSTQPQGTQIARPPVSTPKNSGGGNGGKLLVGGVVAAGGVAAAAIALTKASSCTEPSTSDLTTCSTGNCSACVAWGEKLVPWCDCLEQKHPNETGGTSAVCRDYLAQIKQLKAAYRCEPLPNFTPLPVR